MDTSHHVPRLGLCPAGQVGTVLVIRPVRSVQGDLVGPLHVVHAEATREASKRAVLLAHADYGVLADERRQCFVSFHSAVLLNSCELMFIFSLSVGLPPTSTPIKCSKCYESDMKSLALRRR